MEHDDKQIEQTNTHGGKREGAGAPLGNKNSSKDNRMWASSIKRHAVQNPEKMGRIVNKLFEKAEDGDLAAMREIGDRIDGKSVATTELSGIDGSDLPLGITVKYVKPDSRD
jgi:hypothetical protein